MNKKINYRPEIDGLRGIAILLVVIYHARFYTEEGFFISGGFLGVDIFFVISGYLMTNIILNEIKINGSMSQKVFLNFFESRLRRIWPAYFVLILVSVILFNYFFLGDTLHEFMKTAFAASIFQSNHWIAKAATQYAAETSLNLPLLHTWSLSVEIQFYVIFPFLILASIYFFKKKYFLVFLSISLLSILYTQYMQSDVYGNLRSFYLLPTRLFELLSGSMVALLERRKNFQITFNMVDSRFKNEKSKKEVLNLSFEKFSNLGCLLGASLLLFSIMYLDNEQRHPTVFTIIPVIGTAFLIYFSKGNIFQKILSNKLIVGIGLISYSLYLWHFPIFSFPRTLYFINENSIVSKFTLIFISITIAIISFYVVEKPFRDKKFINFRNYFFLSFISVLLLASSTYYLIKSKKTFRSYPEFIQNNVNKISWKDVADGLGYCYARSKNYCSWNWEHDHIPRIYVVGDSHMSVLERGIVDYAIDKDKKLGIKLMTGRFYLPNFKLYNKSNLQEEKSYADKSKKVEKILTKQTEQSTPAGGNIVIYGAYYSSYLKENQYVQEGVKKKDSKNFYQPIISNDIIHNKLEREKLILGGIKKNIEEIIKKNRLILIYPIPEAGLLVGRKFMGLASKGTTLIEGMTFKRWIKKNKYYVTTPYDIYKNRNKEIIELFDSLDHPNLYKVYPAKNLCDNQVKNRCITHDDKEIFYHDGSHLSPEGANIVNKDIINILDEIYKEYPGDYSDAMEEFDTNKTRLGQEYFKRFIERKNIMINNK